MPVNLKELSERALRAAQARGFAGGWRGDFSVDKELVALYEEVAEAARCYREDYRGDILNRVPGVGTARRWWQGPASVSRKPHGFASELADVVISCLKFAGYLGIDLEAEILRKMDYNDSRKD
jgi:NTP pyrophosphatase (non-canonical NTP hydrolase)